MQHQRLAVIESVEAGMKLVRAQMNVAVLGGRETLYFDTKRFGRLKKMFLVGWGMSRSSLSASYTQDF